MIERNFKNWHSDDVESIFKLQEVKKLDTLDKWLSVTYTLNKSQKTTLEELQLSLQDGVRGWNEEELKFHFIAPLMALVKFKTAHYKSFLERYLSVQIGDYLLKGRVDLMIASGKHKPTAPYFCLHEYKKEKGVDTQEDIFEVFAILQQLKVIIDGIVSGK